MAPTGPIRDALGPLSLAELFMCLGDSAVLAALWSQYSSMFLTPGSQNSAVPPTSRSQGSLKWKNSVVLPTPGVQGVLLMLLSQHFSRFHLKINPCMFFSKMQIFELKVLPSPGSHDSLVFAAPGSQFTGSFN